MTFFRDQIVSQDDRELRRDQRVSHHDCVLLSHCRRSLRSRADPSQALASHPSRPFHLGRLSAET